MVLVVAGKMTKAQPVGVAVAAAVLVSTQEAAVAAAIPAVLVALTLAVPLDTATHRQAALVVDVALTVKTAKTAAAQILALAEQAVPQVTTSLAMVLLRGPQQVHAKVRQLNWSKNEQH